MKSIQVAEFFARIGIKADVRQLQMMLGQMKQLVSYTKQLRQATNSSFKVGVNYSQLGAMRQSLGSTISGVQKLRTEIANLKSANVNVSATSRVRSNLGGMGTGGGGGGGFAGGGGRGHGAGGLWGGATAGSVVRSGLAPVAAGAVAIDMVSTSMKVDAARAALLSVSEDAADANQQFKWLREEADRLGFVFLENARNYTNFVAAGKSVGVGTGEIQKIFSATAKYGRVLGLSNDDLSGTFRALQQMMSKGTVQSEELKGQLGERLPGAVGLAARALGVMPEVLFKMLENGEVLAKDLLPKLALELDAAADANGAFAAAMNMTGAQLAKFLNQWNDFKDAFARAGLLKILTDSVLGLGNAFEAITPHLENFGKVVRSLWELLKAFLNPWLLIIPAVFALGTALTLLSQGAFIGVIRGLWAMSVPLLLTTAAFLAWGAAVAILVLLYDDLYGTLQGHDSLLTRASRSAGWYGDMIRYLAGEIKDLVDWWELLGNDPFQAIINSLMWMGELIWDIVKGIGKMIALVGMMPAKAMGLDVTRSDWGYTGMVSPDNTTPSPKSTVITQTLNPQFNLYGVVGIDEFKQVARSELENYVMAASLSIPVAN